MFGKAEEVLTTLRVDISAVTRGQIINSAKLAKHHTYRAGVRSKMDCRSR